MNKISARLQTIFSHIPPCKRFADVGCDHGYISYLMLEQKKCQSVIYSDVSRDSLKKAEELLKGYKNAKGVHCEGLEKIEKEVDCVLIAGMGGENIITILKQGFFPPTLVMQPMKNTDKLRAYLNQNGYFLKKDFLFFSEDKFYNLIVATRGEEQLTSEQIKYGKDNLSNPSNDFLRYLKEKTDKKQEIIATLVGDKKEKLLIELQKELQLYKRLKTDL